MKKTNLIYLIVGCLLIISCGTPSKVERLHKGNFSAQLVLPKEKQGDFRELSVPVKSQDTMVVQDFMGRDVLIMNAVKDTETGEMVATDVLEAAVVTARFRNVAERHGKVDIEFQIIVPEEMQDGEWQERFHPRMVILEDTVSLDDVLITGAEYRKAQLKGYQQYDKFIKSIVTDSTRFIDLRNLEIFIERNIPEVYAYKYSDEYVSDEEFQSCFGVTERQAIDHYTNWYKVKRNDLKKRSKKRMFDKYVKVPIEVEHLKLDTVMRSVNGEFVYNYIQTIETRPKLRKVDILLSGEVYQMEKRIYTIPESDPLTFYISSLSAFVDNTERYLTKVISRKAEANTACYIDFEVGRDVVKEDLSNNAGEIARIKGNLASLLENKDYDLDSIVVTASASPEGAYASNRALSQRRSESVSRYFKNYLKHYNDSLVRAQGIFVNLDEEYESEKKLGVEDIAFVSHNNPENWTMLDALVTNDFVMDDGEKQEYFSHAAVADPDAREVAMRGDRKYKYYREVLYPRLRTVKFDFHLHRKGMIQDTVHTTVLDSVYMDGVQAIRDRDYERAVTLLRPYNDYNTAIAFCSMDYNASAKAILLNLERTAEVNYMLAVLYSREGDDRNAVQCYIQSCGQNPSFVHRGNLDPEISVLIKKYGLNKEDDIPTDF